jgi:hypothetical protein
MGGVFTSRTTTSSIVRYTRIRFKCLKYTSDYLNYIIVSNIETTLKTPLYDQSLTKDECVE